MKLLLAINAIKLDMTDLDLACYIANSTGSVLTGIFLEDLADGEPYFSDDGLPVDVKQVCSKNMTMFKDACTVRETPCKIHRDRGVPYDELLTETRFADLLVIGPGLSFTSDGPSMPSGFVERILSSAECPVIMASPGSVQVDEVCFAYDGSASSMYAIKQFSYLFPDWSSKRIGLIEIKDESSGGLTERHKLTEWVREHYANVEIAVSEGDVERNLVENIMQKENCLTVMGSFGRGTISSFIKASIGEKLLEVVSKPLFIAHPFKH